MQMIPYILFLIGFVFIIKGGDYFVDTATWMARVTGMPEVLIGATLVSLATTFPELMVSLISTVQNHPDMAMGNAVGSTICNTGLILGLCTMIRPSRIDSRIFTLKGLLLIVYTVIVWLLSFKGVITSRSAFVLLAMLAAYVLLDVLVVKYRYQKRNTHSREMADWKEWMGQIARFCGGLALILIGAQLLVNYGVVIARFWKVPESFISLTMIAFGTSLPELVTSISALIKRHAGISMGNIIGANILNLTMVVGASAAIRPMPVSRQTIIFDLPVSLVFSLVLVMPGIFTRRISRIQAAVLLLGYGAYLGALVAFARI